MLISMAIFAPYNLLGQVANYLQATKALLNIPPFEAVVIRGVENAKPNQLISLVVAGANHSLDSTLLGTSLVLPAFWEGNSDTVFLKLAPQSKRISSLSFRPPIHTPPGIYQIGVAAYVHGTSYSHLNFYNIKIDTVTNLDIQKLQLRESASRNSNDSAAFMVKNQGNTTQSLSITVIGSRSPQVFELVLAPMEKRDIRFEFEIPARFMEDLFTVGILANSVGQNRQWAKVVPIKIFDSTEPKPSADVLTVIGLTESLTISSSGSSPLIVANTRFTIANPNRSRQPWNAYLNTIQFRNSQSVRNFYNFGFNQRNSTTWGSRYGSLGTIAPVSTFYALLPQNFYGTKWGVESKRFQTSAGIYGVNRISTADTINAVGQLSTRIGGPNCMLESMQSATVQEGVLRGDYRTYLASKQSNISLRLGVIASQAFQRDRLGYDGQIKGRFGQTSFSAAAFQSTKNFIQGSQNLQQVDGSLSQTYQAHMFTVSGSYFNQEMENSSIPMMRWSANTSNSLKISSSIRTNLTASRFYMQTPVAGASNNSTNDYVSMETSYRGRDGAAWGLRSTFLSSAFNAKNVLQRKEIAATGSYQSNGVRGQSEINYSFGNAQSRYVANQNFELVLSKTLSMTQSITFLYQPSNANSSMFNTGSMLRWAQNDLSVMLKLNASVNGTGRFTYIMNTTVKVPLNRFEKPASPYKTVTVSIQDPFGQPLQNVMIQTNGSWYITNKQGQIELSNIQTDSLQILINKISLPFGQEILGGIRQTYFVYESNTKWALQTFKTCSIKGNVSFHTNEMKPLILPDFSKFLIRICSEERTDVRQINERGEFSFYGMQSGVWEVELYSIDPSYKTYRIKDGKQILEIESGGDASVVFEIYPNNQGIRIQKGIGK